MRINRRTKQTATKCHVRLCVTLRLPYTILLFALEMRKPNLNCCTCSPYMVESVIQLVDSCQCMLLNRVNNLADIRPRL